jgi:DNA (cytosine-5)-methyltransferase 1
MKTEHTQNDPSGALRYASVCSGIEAVTAAWQPLGLTPAWFSEIDPFANAVLTHHYPHVPNLGDMTRIAPHIACGTVCAPEILVGGTPCQSFSVAGLRKGLTDPRGALTLKYVELANAIDQARITQDQPPAILVWENVPGVLSDQTNAFGCFLGAVSGERGALRPPGSRWTNAGCVYGPQRSIAWRVLDAQYFGVAQRRKRVFVVASAREDFDPAAVLFECDRLRGDTPPRTQARQDTASPTSPGAVESHTVESCSSTEVETSKPDHNTLNVCFGGGNARGAIDRAACLTARGHKCDFEVETFAVQALTGGVSHPLNTANNGKGSSEDGTGRGTPIVAVSHPLTCASAVTEDGNGRGVPIISVSYRLKDGDAVAFAQNSRGEVRLEGGRGDLAGALSRGGGKPGQGLPMIATVSLRGREQGATAELGDDAACALRASSDGGDQARVLLPSFEAHFQCMPASPSDGQSQDGSSWRVRRLMPLECERLQGLPDHYTLVIYRGHPAADGPRYKAIGNSMAVPCVAWIGRRLTGVLRRAP